MSEPFSMELFNRIPSEQVSFYLELAEATGISSEGRSQVNNFVSIPNVSNCFCFVFFYDKEPEEVDFNYKSEGNKKWETLYTFKSDDVKSKITGRFCCGLFEIRSKKEFSQVKVIMTGSRTSPVVSDSLYPKQV